MNALYRKIHKYWTKLYPLSSWCSLYWYPKIYWRPPICGIIVWTIRRTGSSQTTGWSLDVPPSRDDQIENCPATNQRAVCAVFRFFSYLYLLSIPAPRRPHWCSNCLYVRVYLCCTALQASCGSIAKWGSVLLVRSKPEAKIRISGRFWSDLKPRYWKQGYQGPVCLQ